MKITGSCIFQPRTKHDVIEYYLANAINAYKNGKSIPDTDDKWQIARPRNFSCSSLSIFIPGESTSDCQATYQWYYNLQNQRCKCITIHKGVRWATKYWYISRSQGSQMSNQISIYSVDCLPCFPHQTRERKGDQWWRAGGTVPQGPLGAAPGQQQAERSWCTGG